MLSHPGVHESELRAWIDESVASGSNVLGRGYQGEVYLYDTGGTRLVVKTVTGSLMSRLSRRTMLRNELRAYSRLEGLAGIPRCYGLIDQRHLVLEHVGGVPFRRADIADRAFYFERLLELLRAMHGRGVAHGDLKKKDNVLVVDGRMPYVIDFGVAVCRREGFAPLNNYWYRLAQTFDYNAWVKLKYDGNLEGASEADLRLTRRTAVEKLSRALKDGYLRVRGRL